MALVSNLRWNTTKLTKILPIFGESIISNLNSLLLY